MSERQRLRAAEAGRAEGERRRAQTYDRDLAIVRRLAAGESVRAVARDVGVPHATAQTAMGRLRRAQVRGSVPVRGCQAMAEAWERRAHGARARGDSEAAEAAARSAARWAKLAEAGLRDKT